MKQFIIFIATVFLCMTTLVFNQDEALYVRKNEQLKFVASEAAAAAGQYYNYSEYAEGRKVFNQPEAIRAAEHLIKYNLKLDNGFVPNGNSYWRDQITYQIFFYDDNNTVFPTLYTDPDNNFTIAIGDPTVVVRIIAGRGRFRLTSTEPIAVRTAAYEWKSYND